jgi:hypothetical protein
MLEVWVRPGWAQAFPLPFPLAMFFLAFCASFMYLLVALAIGLGTKALPLFCFLFVLSHLLAV